MRHQNFPNRFTHPKNQNYSGRDRQNWLDSDEAKELLNGGNFIEFCKKAKEKIRGIKETPQGLVNSSIDLDDPSITFNELKIATQWAAILQARGFGMSSLRKIFEIVSSGKVERAKFILAYEVGRKEEFAKSGFGEFLEKFLNEISTSNDDEKDKKVAKIKTFLETVIAYHKLINPDSKK